MINDSKIIVVNTPPKIPDQEKRSIVTYFGSSSQDQIIENNSNIILTRLLNRWNGNMSCARPSTHALTYSEIAALKSYSNELK